MYIYRYIHTNMIYHKDEKRQSTDGTIASEKKELELTQGELDAALEYSGISRIRFSPRYESFCDSSIIHGMF